jgi:hypothetical protein
MLDSDASHQIRNEVKHNNSLTGSEELMRRQIRVVALAFAVIVTFSGLSHAQYHDDDDGYYQPDYGQARQYGYQQGFRDGYNRGRHEGRENDPNDFREPDWRQASRGYQQWMGSVEAYQNAYRHGYGSGFRAGYQSVNRGWGDRDADRDEGIYDRGDYAGYGYGANIGYRTGYQDGMSQAREDVYKNKRFNSNPRGKYDDRDHGYRREYGDKNSYKAQYTSGYRDGYESAFRRY